MVRVRRANPGVSPTVVPAAEAPVLPKDKIKTKKELGGKREPKNVRARMADRVIKIVATENPRREGSQAHAHFEKMRGGITIREYLSRFSEADQKVARQWLWNTVQDGYVTAED